METRFCEGQSSKENNSKNINARATVLALCTSSNVDSYMYEFRDDSFRGFQVTERTRFVTDRQTDRQTDRRTDRQTDRRPGKTICLPTLRE